MPQTLTADKLPLIVQSAEIAQEDFGPTVLRISVAGSIEAQNAVLADPECLSGQEIRFSYRGQEVTAKLSIISELLSLEQGLIINVDIAGVNAALPAGNRWEFILPNVKYGVSDLATFDTQNGAHRRGFEDRCELAINGVIWTLRKLYHSGEDILPGDMLVLSGREGTETPHSLLHVSCDQLHFDEASQVADDICWLLELAMAQRVTWVQAGTRDACCYHFISRRSVAIAAEPSHQKPLSNWRDQKIKTYLELAYPVYRLDPKWWQYTLNWYSIVHDNPTIEVAGVIYSILMDRLSTALLRNFTFPKQFEASLDQSLGKEGTPNWLQAQNGLTEAVRGFCPGWPEAKSKDLLKKVKEWNDGPSYPKKIAQAFEHIGITDIERDLIDPRHVLLHVGELRLKRINPLEYFLRLNKLITRAMLLMLDYRGSAHFSRTGEEEIVPVRPILQERIRLRAYFHWEQRAFAGKPGDALSDWLIAEGSCRLGD